MTTRSIVRNSRQFFLVASILLCLIEPTVARAQSALDGFDPNANNLVLAVVVQPDGKILLGGGFSTVSGVTRNRLARLNPDGTLDSAFNPNANSDVNAIALQADGKILVGGFFTTVGGQTRNRIARLNADGTLDTGFDPNANGSVRSIAVQADGKIVAGGQFTTIGGQTRNRIARLNSNGTLDTTFNPNANNTVFAIAIQTNGKILVGGFFNGANSIGGATRNRIARLDPATGLADSFDPNATGGVFAIAVQADGKILAGGDFNGVNSIGGQTRNRIARLDANSGAADSFNPNANLGVFTIAVQADGKILAGGDFNGANSIGGQARNNIARLDPNSGLADSFDPSANAPAASVYSITPQSDGKVLVGGNFSTLAPNGGTAVTRNNIARLEIDGRLDRTLNLNMVGSRVDATAMQADGRILIGGSFTSVLSVTQNNIARLNTDGTLDLLFNPDPNSIVHSIVVQADGKILVGGDFTHIGAGGGQPRNRIARLGAPTGLADSFNPNADSIVECIAIQADGKVLVGGLFTNIGGQTRNFIARLDSTTGAADSFNPNANNLITTIAVQMDGKILVGGNFTAIGGQSRNSIARLDPATGLADSFNPNANSLVESIAIQADGKILVGGLFTNIGGQPRTFARLDPVTGLADSFNPNPNSVVESIAIQADNKILVGGLFTTIGGQTRNSIARLDPVTGLADTFNPNANNQVLSIAIQADGKILAAGGFTSIDGQPRNRIARLTNDTAALQNLAVTQTTIAWTRSGSSPQLERVTFESSTDNVNYSFLGNGTAAGSNWTLSGLNLPTLQNIYIRARGFYRCGVENNSQSITESVRNVFITLPPTPTAVVSRKLHGGTPFDINLPLTGNSGIECRSGGATNDYQIIFTFPSAVTFTNAAVIAGTGSVSSSSGNGTTTITVNLTGVTNAQRITITLFGVSDGTTTGDLSVQMGVLVGDNNANGTVNASDVSQTKSRIGQALNATNFRSDINTNGSINATDTSLIKSRVGTGVP